MEHNDLTIKEVLRAVELASGLSLTGRERRDDYIVTRSMFYKIAYENVDFPSAYMAHTKIGGLVGRNRCTIMHHLKNADQDIEHNRFYKKIYNKALIELKLN